MSMIVGIIMIKSVASWHQQSTIPLGIHYQVKQRKGVKEREKGTRPGLEWTSIDQMKTRQQVPRQWTTQEEKQTLISELSLL